MPLALVVLKLYLLELSARQFGIPSNCVTMKETLRQARGLALFDMRNCVRVEDDSHGFMNGVFLRLDADQSIPEASSTLAV